VTTESSAEQVHPDTVPVSKPGLVTRFVAAVAAGAAASKVIAASSNVRAAAA
jgi:hypothetical protein